MINMESWTERLWAIELPQKKILHPDFSLALQSGLNVCFGVFILSLLLLRYTVFSSNVRLKEFTQTCMTLYVWHSFSIWVAMVVDEGKPDENRNTVLTMGLNVFLYWLNSAFAVHCDSLEVKKKNDVEAQMLKKAKEEAYTSALEDAVSLYGVNEAYCKEIITDGKVMRSFLMLVRDELDKRNIHDASERTVGGKEALEDLLARERLHQKLINSPHVNDNLTNWTKYGTD